MIVTLDVIGYSTCIGFAPEFLVTGMFIAWGVLLARALVLIAILLAGNLLVIVKAKVAARTSHVFPVGVEAMVPDDMRSLATEKACSWSF